MFSETVHSKDEKPEYCSKPREQNLLTETVTPLFLFLIMKF